MTYFFCGAKILFLVVLPHATVLDQLSAGYSCTKAAQEIREDQRPSDLISPSSKRE